MLPPSSVMKNVKRPHKWRTTFNNKDFPVIGEIFPSPTETRPSQAMTMREIEQRYAGGKRISDVLPRPVWDMEDDPDFDDYLPSLHGMDYADKVAFMEASQKELEAINARAEEAKVKAAEKKKQLKEEQEKMFAERLRKMMEDQQKDDQH